MSDYKTYKKEMASRFWDFQRNNFKSNQEFFERPYAPDDRPPVFRPKKASENVIIKEGLPGNVKKSILNQIPRSKRHRWFQSMTSSQALTQSVFGNLKVFNKLDCLAELIGDDGKPIFIRGLGCNKHLYLEYVVDYLGEPRPTNVDVFFSGNYRVAAECKLTETEIGACSAGKQSRECNGQYKVKMGQSERCLKSSIGAKYWTYIPKLFNWSADVDYNPCPLLDTYQLVRNVPAACVQRDGKLDYKNGHVVLLYDERNPAFQAGGDGLVAWQKVLDALKYPSLLKKCTWQQVIASIRCEPELKWLTDSLREKYGF